MLAGEDRDTPSQRPDSALSRTSEDQTMQQSSSTQTHMSAVQNKYTTEEAGEQFQVKTGESIKDSTFMSSWLKAYFVLYLLRFSWQVVKDLNC